ncbi:hypothetical protein BH24CHL6_BH24CHL6_14780 [soil metagenome]
MSHPRRTRQTTDSEQPVLTRLERPGAGRAGGWRLAAGALAVLLVGVVAVGRLGMEEAAAPEPSPRTSPLAVVSPSPSEPSATPEPQRSPEPTRRPTLPPSADGAPDVPRHLDGLPTSIGGEKVYRLAAALERAGQRAILVGGWYMGPECARLGHAGACPNARISDSPATVAQRSHSVTVTGAVEVGSGPRVLRVRFVPDCTAEQENCRPTLESLEVVWRGDLFTNAARVEPQALLSSLKYAFADMWPEPFRDLARCSVAWPPQTYRSVSGGPRMTLVFPTTEDRLAAEAHIVANWPRPSEDTGGQCLDQYMAQPEPAGWISEDNVMLWVSQDDAVRALARAAVLDARSHSQPDQAVVARPFTDWAAVRALRGWDAQLDVLPQHDYQVWGPQLGDRGGEPARPVAYALSDPLLRVLLVFAEPADRRAYQRSVDPADVVVVMELPGTQEALAADLVEAREAGVRWLGFRNLLMQVAGPADFDERLRETLRSELN